jgi:hypothetical protein
VRVHVATNMIRKAALKQLDGLTHHSLRLVRDRDPALDVVGSGPRP